MRPIKQAVVLLFLAAALFVIYAPGLHGPFVLDDEENITKNASVKIENIDWPSIRAALLGNDSGPLKRPLASLSFALNYAAGGADAFFFKLTNVAIHALNAALIYWLTLLLLKTPAFRGLQKDRHTMLAIFVATAWALHPIQLTSVLYVVQRMTSLSSLGVVAGLIVFVHGRALIEKNKNRGLIWMTTGLIGGVAIGITAKETAALLPLYAFTIDYCLFAGERTGTARRELRWFHALSVGIPLLTFAVYLAWHPQFVTDSYATRHFTLLERLLTEARILWLYIKLIIFPISSNFSLFHDDIAVSKNLFLPLTTLLAVIGWSIAFCLALRHARKYSVLSFAILWYLAGHALESSIFGLELAYEHRNYLPSYGVLFGLCCGIFFIGKSARQKTLSIAAVGVCACFALVTWVNANTWSDSMSLAQHSANTHPTSARANDFAAHISLGEKSDLRAAIKYTIAAIAVAPQEASFRINLQILMAVMARDIELNQPEMIERIDARGTTLHIPGIDQSFVALRTKAGLRIRHNGSPEEEITRLLQTRPISVHTISSLERLRHCVLSAPRACSPIFNETRTWFASATTNKNTSNDYRAVLLRNNALICADVGDYVGALENIQQATALLPDFPPYRAEAVNYLIKLGRLEEAERAADSLSSEPAAAAVYIDIKQKIQAERAARPGNMPKAKK